MADLTLAILDGTGTAKTLAANDGGPAGGLIVYHAEDPTQRAALQAALTGIKTAVQGVAAIGAWTDDTGANFILNVKQGVVTWTDTSGNTSTGPGTGARPSGGSLAVDRSVYIAVAAATGYSVGDVLDHVLCFNPGDGAIVSQFWMNATQGTKLNSAPASANIAQNPLPAGAATDGKSEAIRALLAGGITVDASAHTVPVSGPLTASDLTTAALATHADAQALLAAINGQASIQAWTDDSGVFYILNCKGGAFTWTKVDGTTSTGPGAGARPAAGASIVVSRSSFVAGATGTGYSSGDYLDHVVTSDPATGVAVGHYWLNLTTEAKLAAAPAAGDITPVSPLPTNAATDSRLEAVRAILGASADTASTASLMGKLIAALARLDQLHADLTAATPAGELHLGEVSTNSFVATSSLTRSATQSTYAAGSLISANSSVTGATATGTAIANCARVSGGIGCINRVRLSSTNTGAAGHKFRVYFFKTNPTSTVADGGAYSGTLNLVTAIYLGFADVTLTETGTDGAKGIAIPDGGQIIYDCDATASSGVGTDKSLWWVPIALDGYTNAASEKYALALELDRA